jgi:hypothetical protein
VLVIIAERWSQATTYRDTFEALSEKTINMICSEGGTSPEAALAAASFEPTFAAPQEPISQEWFTSLESMNVPGESEWFVHELLDGIRDFQQPELQFDDLADFTTS